MKLFTVLLSVLLLVSLTACGWVTVTPKGEEPPPEVFEPAEIPDADALNNDTETKEEIQSAVEALVPDEYKGLSYSCYVDVRIDEKGARYVVNLQIDVDVLPPESTEIINNLVDAIEALGDSRIAEIEVFANCEMQLVDSNLDLDPSLYIGRPEN